MHATSDHAEAVYEIQVQGELDKSWETYFNGFAISLDRTSDQRHVTMLTAAVADQPALRGMLCKLWDLNLTLISVRRMKAEDEKEKETEV